MGGHRVDSCGSGQGQVVELSPCYNEPSDSTKCGEYDQLKYYKFVKYSDL